MKLSRSGNPARQLYAALADRHYPRLAEVFDYLLRKDHPMAFHYRAWGSNRVSYLRASEELYDRFCYGEAAARPRRHPAFPSPQDSLLYYRLRHKLDSTALRRAVAGRYGHHTLLANCLKDNAGYPGSYAFVQTLCRQAEPAQYPGQIYTTALAAYRHEQDIPLLLRFEQNAFPAIAQFPHLALWALVE